MDGRRILEPIHGLDQPMGPIRAIPLWPVRSLDICERYSGRRYVVSPSVRFARKDVRSLRTEIANSRSIYSLKDILRSVRSRLSRRAGPADATFSNCFGLILFSPLKGTCRSDL